jgi:hypothetical protein
MADTPTATPANALPPEDYLTEKEQDASTGGSGVGPVTPAEEPAPIETMEDLGIGASDPYPSADTPPARDVKTPKAAKAAKVPASDAFGNPIPKGGA